MKTLQDLLKRYAHIEAPDATLKKVFIQSVEKVIDITLEPSQVRIHKKTVCVEAPSVVKNEIRINQKEILGLVSEEVADTDALTAIF